MRAIERRRKPPALRFLPLPGQGKCVCRSHLPPNDQRTLPSLRSSYYTATPTVRWLVAVRLSHWLACLHTRSVVRVALPRAWILSRAFRIRGGVGSTG